MSSKRTKERLIKKHLTRLGYSCMDYDGEVWLTEERNKLSERNGLAQLVPAKRLLVQFAEGDNVWAIRHIRAQRNYYRLDVELRRRLELPHEKRQAEVTEAREEFIEKFKTESANQGWHEVKTFMDIPKD